MSNMELIVVRHATAQPRREDLPDEQRALTPRGRRRFAKAARGLKRLDIRADLLLHSPWLRAVATAELLTGILDGESRVTPSLAEAPSAQLLEELAGLNAERVAIVGHEPWLGELCAWLVAGDPGLATRFVLEKGGVAWLCGTPQPGGMRLQAWFPPRVLRRVRKR